MLTRFADYGYILATVLFTVYGQIVLKWRMQQVVLPAGGMEKAKAVFFLLWDPYIMSGYLAAFLAMLSWMVVLTKFPLSVAYSFTSLSFVLVTLSAVWMLGEPISIQKAMGIALIVSGIIVIAR